MFDILWTILLGIIGGIISSVIVSRVFKVIRANVFKEELNQSLLESLGLKDFQSGFEPLLTPEGNLGMSFKVKMAL